MRIIFYPSFDLHGNLFDDERVVKTGEIDGEFKIFFGTYRGRWSRR
jgi:hypothetical protein